jgi:hypothetical protein
MLLYLYNNMFTVICISLYNVYNFVKYCEYYNKSKFVELATSFNNNDNNNIKYVNVMPIISKVSDELIINDRQYLTKEVNTYDIYVTVGSSYDPVFNNKNMYEYYNFVNRGSTYSYALLTNNTPNITNLLPIIHEQYAKEICTVTTDNYQYINKIAQQRIMYGVLHDNSNYLIIGNVNTNNIFVTNNDLLIYKNKNIEELKTELSDNKNWYYWSIIVGSVLGSVCLFAELYNSN